MAIDIDDIKRLSGPKKLMILVGILLLITYLYWFYFFQPVFDKKSGLKADLESINRQIAARQVVAEQIEKHKKEIVGLEKNLEIILAKLPEQKEIPYLLKSVSEAGREAGLEFILFEPMDPVPKDFYAEIPVKIVVIGAYSSIAVFFDAIAHLPRIATIKDVAIKMGNNDKDGTENLLQADCLMKIYMFLEQAKENADGSKQ